MTRIGPEQHIHALVRARLRRLDRLRGASSAEQPNSVTAAKPQTEVHPSFEGVDAAILERALVVELLTERLGSSLVQEYAFQSVIDDVMRSLRDHSRSHALLEAATSRLSPN